MWFTKESTTPVFNRNTVGTWDNTWVGRISDFLSSTNMSISGGQINNGFRQDDVSIATLFEGTRDLKLVQEGCIHFKIHWVSQILSEDSSTWKAEVQDYRQLFNGKFTYMAYSTDGIGARTAKSHTSLARTWLDKVKKAICTANVKMGDFNMNCKSNLREFDVVLFAGDPSPRIVIFVSPALDKITTLSTTTGMRPAHFKHSDGSRRRWVVSKSCPSGPGIRSSLSAEIFSVDADCTARNDDYKKAIKVEVQLLPRMNESDYFHDITMQDLFEDENLEQDPLEGGIFFRTCIDTGWFTMRSDSMGSTSVPRFTSWEPHTDMADLARVCGVDSLDSPVADCVEEWKTEIASLGQLCQSWGCCGAVLAGGDASFKGSYLDSKSSFGYGFFGIGPANAKYWDAQPRSAIKLLAKGGGLDWLPPLLQNNVRGEIQHLMMVMYLSLNHSLPVLYSVDLLGAAEGFDSVLGWTVTQWLSAENRDLWECIAHLKTLLRQKHILFNVFHNRGHPEVWAERPRRDYTALMEVAHRTDLLADEAFARCSPPIVPNLPGRRRWRLFNGDVEVVGSVRKSVLRIHAEEASHGYLSSSRRGTISHLANSCFWPAINRKVEKTLPRRLVGHIKVSV